MSLLIRNVPRGGGLRLSANATPQTMPLRSGDAVSWLPRCRVGDDQGKIGACAMFSMASWVEIMYERSISDQEVVDVYEDELRRLGQQTDGLFFPQAFEGAKAAGWLPNHKRIVQVSNLKRLSEAPILGGYVVTPAWSETNGAGCFPESAGTENQGYHAVVIVAHGAINGVQGGPWVYIENSWGLEWGWNGIGLMSESQHCAMCMETWILE